MFVNEDCVDSRSDVDDHRTRDCLYDESRPERVGTVDRSDRFNFFDAHRLLLPECPDIKNYK